MQHRNLGLSPQRLLAKSAVAPAIHSTSLYALMEQMSRLLLAPRAGIAECHSTIPGKSNTRVQ